MALFRAVRSAPAEFTALGSRTVVRRFARTVWGVAEADDLIAAKAGVDATVDFFRSIGMPTNLRELGVEASDDDLRALAMDATMNDTLKLSRIRPLDANAVEEIFRGAL